MKRKEFEQRLQGLKNNASRSWKTTWMDLAKYLRPTRGNFTDEPNKGSALDHKTILDGFPMRAVRILAAGMTSGLTSPSRPWFKLGFFNDPDVMNYEPARIWVNDVEQRMMSVFAKSNIYGVLHTIYEEIGVFGTASAAILEDFQNVIRGMSFTSGEYWLGIGDDCRVNTFAREYHLTVGNIVSRFGYENCSPSVKNLYDLNKIDEYIKIAHLIEPNDKRIPYKKDYNNMAFRSVYWEISSPEDTFLKTSGFEDFPILSPRWDITKTSDAWGKGPGWDALGDAKMLQKMQKDKLIALDKVIDPPVQVNSSLGNNSINMLPGGITRYSGNTPDAGVKPSYQINPDLKAIEFSIQETRQAIGATFYTDLFLMLAAGQDKQMTAREVVEKHEEKLLMLGPVLERLESELLDPLIERTFNIMYRNNLLPEIPEEIQGMDLKIEYISMLAQAQKMVGTTAVEQLAGFVGNISAAYPEVLDVIDPDEAVSQYGEMLGVPPKIVRSKEQVAVIRKKRAQEQQIMQQQQQAANAVQGAKVLSETKVGQGNALEALMGAA